MRAGVTSVGTAREVRRKRRRSALLLSVLLSTARTSAREVATVFLLLGILAAAVFGSHVLKGGFYNDDWSFSVIYRFAPGFFDAVAGMTWQWFRPVTMVYWPLTHALFGLETSLHLAWAIALAVLVSVLLYLLLRTLRMERVHAGVIAALVLLFPPSDSTRLWATGSIALVAIAFYLAGTLVALHGFRRSGRRAVVMHLVAVSLYALSVMSYEVAAVAILASGALYAYWSGWRRALPRWIADVAVIATVLALVTSNSWNKPQPLLTQLRHAGIIADQALWVLTYATVPFAGVRRTSVLALLVAVVLAGALVSRLLPVGDLARAQLRRWLLTAGAAIAAMGVGYAMYVPADPDLYVPLGPGQHNRMNVLAAVGFVLLVYSLAMVAATLVFRGLPNWEAWSAGLAVAVGVAIGAGYVQDVRADGRQWDRAARIQEQIVRKVRELVGDPRPGSVLYVSGFPTEAAPGIPTFTAPWDLDGALRIAWDEPSLAAYPAVPGTSLTCGRRRITVHSWLTAFGPAPLGSYGRTFLIDVATSRSMPIRGRASCVAANRFLSRSPPPAWADDGEHG